MEKMGKVLVIGCGAAGMAAAVFAARCGHEIHIYEKNDKPGKKLFITGKGRCNLTNASGADAFFASVKSNPKFLYSAFGRFPSERAIEFFEGLGLKTVTERGNRVFPASGHSSDVIKALKNELDRLHVQIHFDSEVKKILTRDGAFSSIVLKDGQEAHGDCCIVATGGMSYPLTGSTGDGYRFAAQTGHSVTRLSPSLVPVKAQESFVKELQGLSLKNVGISIYKGTELLYEDFGEMLFTHFGVSGPVVLSASSVIGKALESGKLFMYIDLKPALSPEQLDLRVLRDFGENKNREFKNAVDALFPAKLRPVITALCGIDPAKKVNGISREERLRFVRLIKNFKITLTGLRGFDEAVITKGGVDVRQVDPSTMESRIVRGLYFAGEVLDLDALTGGFNLQIAWSTAYAAGNSALRSAKGGTKWDTVSR